MTKHILSVCLIVCVFFLGCSQQESNKISHPRLEFDRIKQLSDPKDIYKGLLRLWDVSVSYKEHMLQSESPSRDDFLFAVELGSALAYFSVDKFEDRISCNSLHTLLLDSHKAESFDELPAVYTEVYQTYKRVCDDPTWEQAYAAYLQQVPVRFTFYDELEKQKFELSKANKKVYESKEDKQAYYVVVGTFKSDAAASRLAISLMQEDLPVMTATLMGKNDVELERIQIGPYIGKRRVNAAQNQLAALGYADVYLIHAPK